MSKSTAFEYMNGIIERLIESSKFARDSHNQLKCDCIYDFLDLSIECKMEVIKSKLFDSLIDWNQMYCFDDEKEICEFLINNGNINYCQLIDIAIYQDEFPQWKIELLKPSLEIIKKISDHLKNVQKSNPNKSIPKWITVNFAV